MPNKATLDHAGDRCTMTTSDPSNDSAGAMAGIRVLDLSRVLAGPWCTQSFADMGAEILKIESPGPGDETRSWSPPNMGGHAAYFTCANRGKASLVLDLKMPADRDRLLQAVAACDVMVENFRAGSLERLGLGPEVLFEANPALILCSISGYGRTGPEKDRAGYDFVIQGESGLMAVTGEEDGPPTKVGVAVSDLFTGLYASQAVLGALLARQRSRQGIHIDVSMFDCQIAAMANVAANALATGTPAGRYGNGHPNVVPYRVFDAADKPFVLAIGNDQQFGRLCREVIGQPDIAVDPRFLTNDARSRNRDALNGLLAEVFREQSADTWMDALDRAKIPAGRINNVTEALTSDQARARDLVRTFDTPDGDIRVVRHPVVAPGLFANVIPPPAPGEGGEALLKAWGVASDLSDREGAKSGVKP